jgi:KTSC domain
VEFNHGKVHEYGGVPPEMDQNRKDADPQGSYFAQNINIKGGIKLTIAGRSSLVLLACWPAGAKAKAALLNQASSFGDQHDFIHAAIKASANCVAPQSQTIPAPMAQTIGKKF